MPVRPSVQQGIELGYAQITATQASISTLTDITGLTIAFTVGTRPVMVEVFIPLYTQVTSSGTPLFFITDSSNNEIARGGGFTVAAGANAGGVMMSTKLPAGTGSYTAKARAQTTAGTLTINASNTGASTYHPYIQAIQV
jgi:hypothetical protein